MIFIVKFSGFQPDWSRFFASKFDEYIETVLTRRHTKETKGRPEIHTILPASTGFDFLEDGSYTCVATNLPEDEFSLAEIKHLYRLRWSEETSFRELKHTIGLIDFHSRNFATAVNVCRSYLRAGGDENEMMLLIQRHLTPVRPDRKYPLNLRPKRNRDFVYRAA